MPVTGPHLRVDFRYTFLGQKCENVQYYRLDGAAFLTASVLGVLEALWANMEGVLRAITPANLDLASWDSLLGSEVGGGLGFGEYAVPTAQRIGLRAGGADTDLVTSFMAGGIRQTVNSRLTRPGQKRIPFVTEGDVTNNALTATYLGLLDDVAEAFSTPRTLGVPVATGVLFPVVGGTIVAGTPTVWQDIVGYVVNPDATSQVSRKKGRGS